MSDDRLDVRRVVDAGLLSVDALDDRLDETLVAVPDDRQTVLGAIVLDSDISADSAPLDCASVSAPISDHAHIVAIAVRRSRRGQGIGTALVRAAAERHPVMTAAFDQDLRPFYRSLAFDIFPTDREDNRLFGVLDTTDCDSR